MVAKAKAMGGRKNLKWVIAGSIGYSKFPGQRYKGMSVQKANAQTDKASKSESCKILVDGGIATWDAKSSKCKATPFMKQSRMITMKTLRRYAKWACNKDDTKAGKHDYAQCKVATFFDVVLRKFGLCKGQVDCSKFMVAKMDWTEGAAKLHAEKGDKAGMFDFSDNNKKENVDLVAK